MRLADNNQSESLGRLMSCIRASLTRTALSAVVLALPALTSAQPYPSKPVKFIVGVPPGGSTDLIARLVAQRLTSAMGQQFIVENKPGAGGTIAFAAGVRSPPDGHTLTFISAAYTVSPSAYKLAFDPIGDMTPIIQVSEGPLLLVVHPSLPAKTTQELITLAKSKPGKLNYASGHGTTSHLATELFASMAGIKINNVPYKGAAPALTDTIAGQTDLFITSIAAALPHVKAGKLRALAVTTPKRVPAAPAVPTVAESGVPGYEVLQWYGLIGPKGLPSPIASRLNRETANALASKEVVDQLQREGMSPVGGTPEQFLALIKREIQTYRKVAADVGLKVE
jgi:tripartite-type tricarboxylate transporter receptor subunit TctC